MAHRLFTAASCASQGCIASANEASWAIMSRALLPRGPRKLRSGSIGFAGGFAAQCAHSGIRYSNYCPSGRLLPKGSKVYQLPIRVCAQHREKALITRHHANAIVTLFLKEDDDTLCNPIAQPFH